MPGKKQKVVVVGADGQLGFDIVRVLGADFEVVAYTRADFDVTDAPATAGKILALRPDIVINTAGFVRVADCERDPEKSFAVNVLGAYNVALAAARVGASVLYISTNYVFDGTKEVYTEEDIPNPLNIYGASKLAGEVLMRIANPKYYIIRASNFFGVHAGKGPNFVSLMFQLAKQGNEISVVDDEFTAPTYTKDLAEKIKEMISKPVSFGIYHVANIGRVSMFEFAQKVFIATGLSPKLTAVKTADRVEPFRRPRSAALASKALPAAGVTSMRSLDDALRAYLVETGIVL